MTKRLSVTTLPRYHESYCRSIAKNVARTGCSMCPQDFFDLLRRRPFVPFRIFATDGRTFDVRHPDQALVLRCA